MPTKKSVQQAQEAPDLLEMAKNLLTESRENELTPESVSKASLATTYAFVDIAESLRAIIQQHQEG